MSGDLNHGPICADIARQASQPHHVTTDDITALYAPQLAALTRPPRTGTSPD